MKLGNRTDTTPVINDDRELQVSPTAPALAALG